MKSNALDVFSDEILVQVLSWVPPTDLLTKTALVSTRFADLLRDVLFWQNNDLIVNDNSDNTVLRKNFLNRHQLQRYCMFVAARRDNSNNPETAVVPACLELGSVLVDRRSAENILGRSRITMRACLASTTDHVNELAENVLTPLESEAAVANDWNALPQRGIERVKWWSSAPVEESFDTTETLVFATKYPAALISQVCIKPLRDPYTYHRVYSWRNTIIKAYRLGQGDDDEDSGDEDGLFSSMAPPSNETAGTSTTATMRVGSPCAFKSLQGTSFSVTSARAYIDALLLAEPATAPVYESPTPIPCDDTTSDDWMSFALPECGVVANVICITLVGKCNRQLDTSGYYACVESVFVRGIPLYTHADQLAPPIILGANARVLI